MNKVEEIVRFYVKKFLSEALKDFDSLVESKVELAAERYAERQALLNESVIDYSLSSHLGTSKNKKPMISKDEIVKKLGVTDDIWSSIYEDTLTSSNPVLNEGSNYDEPPPDRPEVAPEHALREAGLFMDFSKHMEAFDRIDKKNQAGSADSTDAEMKRREILNNTIKR